MVRGTLTLACFGALFSTCPFGFSFQLALADGPIAIIPRIRPAPVAETQPVLRVDSCLIQIPTHVTTAIGASVTNLVKENFQLGEDGVEQTLAEFSHDDAPISVGVVFDTSGSMQNKMQKASEAAAALFRTAGPEDEFFLVKFSGRARLTVPFTDDSGEIYKEIVRTRPSGQTSLLDAVQVALTQMKSARNLRKALVIFSDGGDNWSRHTIRQVKSALMESDVQVYAMGIFDPNYFVKHTAEERRGPRLLDELAELSGGRHFPVDNLDDLPAIASRIGRELRDQYVLGYYSTNGDHDGKYRLVRLNLVKPGPAATNGIALRTYYRQGYYAPAQ
jgi:Ca-activated chloride channel family protein